MTAGSLANNYPTHDWAGRVLSSSQVTSGTTYPMSYTYDLAGELTSITFPSGRLQNIGYDTGGRASTVTGTYQKASTTYATLTGADTSSAAYGYFPNGAVAYMDLGPNKLPEQSCQNIRLQSIGVRLGLSGGTTTSGCVNSNASTPASGDILNLAIGFGVPGRNNGNIVSEAIVNNDPLNVTQNFTYDAVDRLSTASEGSGWSRTYDYDAFGNNWVTSPVPALSQFAPVAETDYNTKNQLIATNSALWNQCMLWWARQDSNL